MSKKEKLNTMRLLLCDEIDRLSKQAYAIQQHIERIGEQTPYPMYKNSLEISLAKKQIYEAKANIYSSILDSHIVNDGKVPLEALLYIKKIQAKGKEVSHEP